MLRLLIADAEGELAKGIEKQLGKLYQVKICLDGTKLIEQVNRFEPDILLLDMSMRGTDCLALLQSLSATGKQTTVLVLLNIASDYILDRLQQLGVQHVMTKPCKVNFAVSHIRQIDFLRQHPEMTDWCLENETENILLDLGFSVGKPRYYTLGRAIAYKYAHIDSQMKQVYYYVADEQKTTASQVEKAIRDAIVDAYKIGDPALWRMYFHPRKNGSAPYPTNEEFIARIVECLLQKTRIKKPYIAKAE